MVVFGYHLVVLVFRAWPGLKPGTMMVLSGAALGLLIWLLEAWLRQTGSATDAGIAIGYFEEGIAGATRQRQLVSVFADTLLIIDQIAVHESHQRYRSAKAESAEVEKIANEFCKCHGLG